MSDIERRIEERIRAFADELRALLRDAAHQAIDEALGATASPPLRTRSKPKRASSKKRRPRPKGVRRTAAQMDRDIDALRAHIHQHPGQNAQQIAAALGMSTRELPRPLKKLIAAGDIRKAGVKSHTRYYSARESSGLPAPSARRATNSGQHAN